ncbi:aminotransferase class V-fold PLP-dependent enzyme [Candidatus Foliamicus sp.]
MLENANRIMQESGTAAGVSRRLFLGAAVAGATLPASAALGAGLDSARTIRDAAAAGMSEDDFWACVRGEFLISDELAYMNSGTLGPMPKAAYYAVVEGYRGLAADPGRTNRRHKDVQEELRQALADFAHSDAGEVALTRNTTEGMSFIANGLDLKAGDEVLCSFHEHPGGLEPWKIKAKRHGVVVKELPFPIPTPSPADILNRFEDAITPRTRVISVSHITFPTGCMLPVKELAALARPRGILTVVDGAHALGMLALDLDALGADFYASSPYKWLGAPVGTGFLYLRRESQDKLWPTVASMDWDDTESGARRYDRLSQRAGPLLEATLAAVEFQNAVGRQRIERRIRALAARLRERLEAIPQAHVHTSAHPQLSGGLIGFTLQGFERQAVVDALWDRHRVWVRETDMGLNTVRASTHHYNTEAQVDRLAEGLQDIIRRGAA